MENKDFEQIESYIYIETILENLKKVSDRITETEVKQKKIEKKIKILNTLLILLIILIIFLIVAVVLLGLKI